MTVASWPAHALAYRPGNRLRPGAGAGRLSTCRRSNSAIPPAAELGDGAVFADGTGRFGAHRHRRQAGICRLLGISARRGDLHLAGPSLLGRRGADRCRRQAARHRLAAPADDPQGRGHRHQHGRADQPAAAHPRRHADPRPASTRPPRPVARRVLGRKQRRRGGDERRRRRPGRQGRPAARRRHLRRAR